MGGDGSLLADKEVCLEVLHLVTPEVKHDVPRVDRRVQLVQQVGSSHNESCAPMPTGPTHTVELEL
eukprot:3784883-Pleurochrysis_carterae.AAC.1